MKQILTLAALVTVCAGATSAVAKVQVPTFYKPEVAQARLYAAAVDHGMTVGRDERRSGSLKRIRAQAAKLWIRLHPWAVRHARAIERAKARTRVEVSPHPHLDRIAQCESGGSPTAVSPDGTYRGKYQFDYQTWASVGGSGDPAAASEAEQDMRARMLYARRGSSPWPVCQYR